VTAGPTSHARASRTETQSAATVRRTSMVESRWAPSVA
jgi:hypothetical protein